MTPIVLALLRLYKWLLSPMLPAACRFTPTCSEYAAEAVALRGTLRGSALALWRLLRCHPFSRGGFDPVPVDTHLCAAQRASRVPLQAACHPERSEGSVLVATARLVSQRKQSALSLKPE